IDLASRQGHAGIVRKVLPYCSQEVLEGWDLYGNNLLTVPALKGYLDVVRDLVVACPKLLVALDDHGNDAIMKAASSGKDDVLRYLLPIAASDGLERMNDFDRNAIMLAVRRGSAEAVRELVPFCSDAAINAVNGEGDTALMQALKGDLYVRRASDELFFELLKHPGHDLSLTTRNGQTLEELAEQADRPVVVLALKKYREEHPSEAVAKSASRPGRFVPCGPSF
ncbi:MAG: ankyrin repeat domain-containing protein, partial [Alphaproteobacteria bacterium]|nr:ankyrin repeat domain-containing protein [Alphaproteobacteria bacterium]